MHGELDCHSGASFVLSHVKLESRQRDGNIIFALNAHELCFIAFRTLSVCSLGDKCPYLRDYNNPCVPSSLLRGSQATRSGAMSPLLLVLLLLLLLLLPGDEREMWSKFLINGIRSFA